jgi:hypothetical protein
MKSAPLVVIHYSSYVGIDPDQDLHGRTSVSVGPSPSSRAKDIPTSGLCSHTSFESLRTPRSLRRDASLEQANPSLAGDRKFASDPCVAGTLEA